MKLLCPVSMSRRETLRIIDQNHSLIVSTPGLLVRLVELLEIAVGKGAGTSSGSGSSSAGGGAGPSGLGQLDQLMTGNMNRQLSRMMRMMMEAHRAARTGEDGESGLSDDEIRVRTQEAIAEAMGVAPSDIDQALGVVGMGGDENMRNSIDAMPLRAEYRGSMSLSQMTVMQHLVELLFSVAILCSGKRKIEVQDILAECGLVHTLGKLFDAMDWTPGHRQGQGPHGPGCQCNPKSAPKIQFLRLVHNFCDRQSRDIRHRLAILSVRNHFRLGRIREIMQALPMYGLAEGGGAARGAKTESEASTTGAAAATGDGEISVAVRHILQIPCMESQYTRDQLALLTKIMDVLGDASGDSPIKFWLATCVESFVRGSGPEAQVFVALGNKNTLLDVVVDEICRGEGTGCGGLQTNFDMLGELVKFNPIVLRILDAKLDERAANGNSQDNNIATERSFEQFMQIVCLHLVDSNVLLRAVLLTVEMERKAGATDAPTRFHAYIDEHRMTLLADMCTIVSAGDVSQENLCCLNSALVFLVFARRHGEAATVIAQLHETERGAPGSVVRNFRQLLWFWTEYYHVRAGDRRSLESSSRMNFLEFAEMVDMLIADDGGELALLKDGSVALDEFEKWKMTCWAAIQEKLDRQVPMFRTCPLIL